MKKTNFIFETLDENVDGLLFRYDVFQTDSKSVLKIANIGISAEESIRVFLHKTFSLFPGYSDERGVPYSLSNQPFYEDFLLFLSRGCRNPDEYSV